MRRFTVGALLAALVLASSCSGRQKRPPGPAPEYERPVVMPWDSGRPVDPFENIQGEEVTDDEPEPADAGATPLDGALPEAAPDAGDAALPLDSGLG